MADGPSTNIYINIGKPYSVPGGTVVGTVTIDPAGDITIEGMEHLSEGICSPRIGDGRTA
jgi:hypothetical protein